MNRRKRGNGMRFLDAPEGYSLGFPPEELSRWGYTARHLRTKTDTIVFYDTHDGAFFSKNLVLSYSRTDAAWRLSKGGKEILEEAGSEAIREIRGRIAPTLQAIRAPFPSVPILKAEVSEVRHLIGGVATQPIHAISSRWRFTSPILPTEARGLFRLTIRGPSREAANFSSILESRLHFTPSGDTVMKKGLTLLGFLPPGAGLPKRFKPAPQDTVEGMRAKIIGGAVWRMRVNAEGPAPDLDAESIHDLRVAARRGRSALRLFRETLDPHGYRSAREELRWIARLLGDVRDLDVLSAGLESMSSCAAGAPLLPLLDRIHARRTRASASLAAAMKSDRFTAIPRLLESLCNDPERNGETGETGAARRFAQRRVDDCFLKLKSWMRRPAETFTDGEMHRVRILLKRLRHALDFFRPLFGKKIRGLRDSVVEYQDCLGRHQDAVTAFALLEETLREIDERDRGQGLLPALGGIFRVEDDIRRTEKMRFIRWWATARTLMRRWEAVRGSMEDGS